MNIITLYETRVLTYLRHRDISHGQRSYVLDPVFIFSFLFHLSSPVLCVSWNQVLQLRNRVIKSSRWTSAIHTRYRYNNLISSKLMVDVPLHEQSIILLVDEVFMNIRNNFKSSDLGWCLNSVFSTSLVIIMFKVGVNSETFGTISVVFLNRPYCLKYDSINH